MKKISHLFILILLILLINIGACTGYKPIFSSSKLEFKIADYSIMGDKKLGKQFYYKLYNLSKSSRNTSEIKNIFILINATKEKNVTSKDSAGKILAYKINLSVSFTVKDFMTGNQILSENFSYSSSYKAQDQYSETIKLENRSIENLVNKTYQNLLIRLTENI
tara:strand:- start:143 stop:634 length:492 start_codon:yes stop_codon:yes gene_type:complete